MSAEWFKENAPAFSGEIAFDQPLGKYTYYRIGGPAEVVAFPKTKEDLGWLSRGIQETGISYFVLGAGSNLLVSDQGYPGLVIRMGRMNLTIEELAPNRLRTGASVAVSTLLRRASQEGWAGLEFLSGIPGSVGGVVVMNGGTHLGEAKDRLKKVETFSLSRFSEKPNVFEGDQLKFQYRKNLFLPKDSVVWSAQWEIQKQEPSHVKQAIDENLARRKATQPIDFPSCGSVFKNPKSSGLSAWQVVDKLGLRGHRIGGAQFSEKHSNFIINLGGAKASDVRGLIELAKTRAQSELGILLEEEVIYVGTN